MCFDTSTDSRSVPRKWRYVLFPKLPLMTLLPAAKGNILPHCASKRESLYRVTICYSFSKLASGKSSFHIALILHSLRARPSSPNYGQPVLSQVGLPCAQVSLLLLPHATITSCLRVGRWHLSSFAQTRRRHELTYPKFVARKAILCRN